MLSVSLLDSRELSPVMKYVCKVTINFSKLIQFADKFAYLLSLAQASFMSR